MVKVTNINKLPYIDKYAGNRYEFPVNETVEIPNMAAQHIFGWTENGDPIIKNAAYLRMGLLKIHEDNIEGKKERNYFNNFKIEV